jgi:dTDP-glucose 4,6-dehydratase/UDP-glucuronate decarboxylase
VYGDPPPEMVPTPETFLAKADPAAPRACYDEAKRFGETLCAIYQQNYGLDVKVARPIQVYGPGIEPEDNRAFAEFLFNAVKDEPITLRSKGLDKRSYCYLGDAAIGFWHILLQGTPGGVYNVGNSDTLVSIAELAHVVASIPYPPLSVQQHISDEDALQAGSPAISCPDVTKLAALVGSPPRVDLVEGFTRTYTWLRSKCQASA